MKLEVEFQPIGRKIQVEKGTTILTAAQSAGAGLLATCGGQASCGSCIVQLVSGTRLEGPDEIEKENLTSAEQKAGYCLACRTRIQESLVVHIPSKSLSTPQRLQIEGKESSIAFNPKIQVFDISLPSDQCDNSHNIRNFISKVLKEKGMGDLTFSDRIGQSLEKKVGRKPLEKIRVVINEFEIISLLPQEIPVLGLAVDIGTTKIAGYLVDMTTGTPLSKHGCMNPQISYGDDVMARITFALNNEAGAVILQDSIIQAINQLAVKLCHIESEISTKSIEYLPSYICDTVLVGNTAMHHICLGLPLQQLGQAPYVPALSHSLDLPVQQLKLNFSPGSFVHLLPNVAGFVGADHISMLLAAGILAESQNTLYIDIGTNTEVTLLIDGRMLCCSTASGPAFEGAHIKNGMRAADGAIERVWIHENTIKYQTINNTKPVGICGSGIIDAIAQMFIADIINKRGGFNPDTPLVREGEKGWELVIAPAQTSAHGQDITINRKDISEIQLAKGAIRAGIELLLSETGNKISQVKQVIVAGAFGSFINIQSAKILGLFPNLPVDCFKQVGNAAGMGARQSLISHDIRDKATEIKNKLEYIELAGHPDFTEAFTQSMMFEPCL